MQIRLLTICQLLVVGFVVGIAGVAIPIKAERERVHRLKLDVERVGATFHFMDHKKEFADKIADVLGPLSPEWLRSQVIRIDLVSSEADDALLARLQPYLNDSQLNLSESRITGVGLTSAAQLYQVVDVHAHASPITDAGLEQIAQIPRLQRLSLSSHKISSSGFQWLENCKELKYLYLSGANVDDGCLKHIRRIRNLEVLCLNESNVSNAGLHELRGHPHIALLQFFDTRVKLDDAALADLGTLPSLEFVDLSQCNVTDVGLANLSVCHGLKELRLNGTRISDVGLKSIASLKNLQELVLDDTQITDEGLKHLKALPNLKDLSLGGVRWSELRGGMISNESYRQHSGPGCVHVTDAGLEHLLDMPALESIKVFGTNVTDSGVDLVLARRPSLRVAGPSRLRGGMWEAKRLSRRSTLP